MPDLAGNEKEYAFGSKFPAAYSFCVGAELDQT